MKQPIYSTTIEQCAHALRNHGFEVQIAPDAEAAGEILREELTNAAPKAISYGDSMTVQATGVIDELRKNTSIPFYDGFDHRMTRAERIEIRRQGIIADFFFTGINAISVTGSLFWRDMVGNRVASVAFGPRRVVLLAGKNKIVDNAEQAMQRIKEIAAPRNVARRSHAEFKTPCAKTGVCMDCNSPDRICNSTLILDRCYPKGRILVVLIDQELGL